MQIRFAQISAAVLTSVLLAVAAPAQEEGETPGAIPDPSTYQGSMQMQRQEEQQDQQSRQQLQQQWNQLNQPYTAPQNSYAPRGSYQSQEPGPYGVPLQRKPTNVLEQAQLLAQRGQIGAAARTILPLALKGNANAEYGLGLLYMNGGQGLPRNTAMAITWYRKAAAHGSPEAMNNLGQIYGMGWGVRQDNVEAYRWFTRAIAAYPRSNGDGLRQSAQNRNYIVARMSYAQLMQAQQIENSERH